MIPRYAFGDTLADHGNFRGVVDAIFRNFASAVECGIVDDSWWDEQAVKPSTRNQIFYSITGSRGAVLIGENDARMVCRVPRQTTAVSL